MNQEHKIFADEFIKDAGMLIREGFFKNLEKVLKDDDSILTEYDTKINDLLVSRVQAQFPDHAIYGEESGFVGSPDAKYRWVCDPIDGTRAFSMSLPHVTCMLSLLEDGQAIYSVISDPILDRSVSAEKGKGAFFDGKLCVLSNQLTIEHAALIFSVNMTHSKIDTWALGKALQNKKVRFSFVPVGMSAFLLLSGNADAVVCPFFSDYEYVTYKLLFDEVGIAMTALNGNEIVDITKKDQGFIAARAELHAQFVEVVQPFAS